MKEAAPSLYHPRRCRFESGRRTHHRHNPAEADLTTGDGTQASAETLPENTPPSLSSRYRMTIPSGTLSPSIDLEKWQIARAALQTCRPLG